MYLMYFIHNPCMHNLLLYMYLMSSKTAAHPSIQPPIMMYVASHSCYEAAAVVGISA
jgi:hypothetical protein